MNEKNKMQAGIIEDILELEIDFSILDFLDDIEYYIDDRIFDTNDETINTNLKVSPIKLNKSAISRYVRKEITDDAISRLSDIIYTQLGIVVDDAKCMMEIRKKKVLQPADIYKSLFIKHQYIL